jgi:hypothetical protein
LLVQEWLGEIKQRRIFALTEVLSLKSSGRQMT